MFGATGTAGHATTLTLRDAGYNVTALGRTDPKIDGVAFQAADIHAPDLSALKSDVVISCLASRTGAPADAWQVDHDANLRVLEAAKSAGTGHFVLLSAICVQKPRLAFQYAKLAFEDTLKRSGLTYSIVRPTAYFKSLSGQLDRLRAAKPYLMFGGGTLTACKPISDGDLGSFITSTLTDTKRQNAVLPIGGPGPALTPLDMGAALFEVLQIEPKYRSVSPHIIAGIAQGLSLAGKVIPTLQAKADLARIGHYYATESMLLWDEKAQQYDADATPEFGSETLFDFYRKLASGEAHIERGDHAVF
ncbi:NAD(P)H-binding protein [Sulfitobacter noctilucicola]|uniref:NAD(P)H-binding protein n=1 Tax=Sulfitobacter noctilucicola TaxID=1342301 RepID=UPI000561E44A|nr:NAD(P)H-binding protein [Sulfitobacter noctilucicola]